LRSGGREGTSGRERNRANRFLVVSQLTLAAILLVGAGLLIRSFQAVGRVDPGFRSEGILSAQLMLPPARYHEPGRVLSLYDQIQEKIGNLPGVTSVILGMNHPLENTWWNGIRFLDHPAPPPGESPMGIFRPVSAGYFATLGIPVLAGREFEPSDRTGQRGVMVVNQAFARRYFPDHDPVRERVEFTPGRFIWGEGALTEFEIVGIVGDVRFNGFRQPSEPAFHIPMHQFPYWSVKILVQATGDLEALAGSLQAEVWSLDPDLPVTQIRTLDRIVASATAQDRFNASLLAAFASVALLLAAAGIYGILSYTVARRRAEMGIRMALGAEPLSLLRRVVQDAMAMAVTGMVLGLALSLALGRFVAALLFGVPSHDPIVLLSVSLLLAATALVSGFIPALRAARSDPMLAVRAE
jgi:putative ABC transport system permease protein